MSKRIIKKVEPSFCDAMFLVGSTNNSFFDSVGEFFSPDIGGAPIHLHIYDKKRFLSDRKPLPTTVITYSVEEDES